MKKISHTAAIYLFSILILIVFMALKRFDLSPWAVRIMKASVGIIFCSAGFFIYHKTRKRHGS